MTVSVYFWYASLFSLSILNKFYSIQKYNWIYPFCQYNFGYIQYGVFIMQDIITRLLALIEQSGLDDKQILSEIGLSPKSTLIADWRRKK